MKGNSMPVPSGYKKACKFSDLKENEGKQFIIDDVDVALFKIGEEVFALNNLCAHQHAAILHDGFIEDGYVTCPAHGWQFSLRTGRMPEGRKGIDAYEVIIESGIVYVKVFKKELNW
jgi:NAD(P)H-dependent nitrite reductase small subunit